MQRNIPGRDKSQSPPMRAVIEVIDGELKFYPIANSDGDERRLMEAFRLALVCGDFGHLVGQER